MRPRKVIFPIGPSIAYVELTQGLVSIIDIEDASWVSRFNWHAVRFNRSLNYYALRNVLSDGARRPISLHRQIVDPAPSAFVDHKNGNTLDNRRSNLRSATPQQNTFNRGKGKNNTSGFKGVSYCHGKWLAKITHNWKQIFIGYFNTPEEAHAAYSKTASEFHGEFVRTA